MNDEIKKLIREILGDFPEGFNAGAVAGVPGWPGDMAYLLQEYPRALLTDTPLRPPVEYAGTTDSIAKAAGYEIPGTLSGQLGAAVGGLLSPGPGDLAKFAPLLGAIPFWHGSPHKFDAFDLSKMGSGEGAQAYGWGAYGADAADTAKTYAADRSYVGRVMSGKDAGVDWTAERLAQDFVDQHGDDAASAIKSWLKQAQSLKAPGMDAERAKATAALDLIERGEVTKKGNLYRGEYAWPDPAKEAATPLTGEDLLQWDRPLSEQPGVLHKVLASQDLARHAERIMERPVASLTGKDLQRALIGYGEDGARGAALALREAGIPGIRYLDGQSRDGGSGTYNYVMFDDKGIKLLERNGKPIRGLLNP